MAVAVSGDSAVRSVASSATVSFWPLRRNGALTAVRGPRMLSVWLCPVGGDAAPTAVPVSGVEKSGHVRGVVEKVTGER